MVYAGKRSFALVVLMAVAPLIADNGPATTQSSSPCTLLIRLDKHSYKRGEGVFLTLLTQNVSPHSTILAYPDTEPSFNVTYADKPLEYTRMGRSALEAMKNPLSRFRSILKGDQSKSKEYLLSEWVDLTLPGKYTVSVDRPVFDATSSDSEHVYCVKSNQLQFEITGDVLKK